MNGVYWCDNCNVPLLDKHCDLCGNAKPHRISNDLNPVFKEEMAMLRELFNFEKYIEYSRDYLLWNSGVYYYCNGNRVASVSVSSSTPKVSFYDAISELSDIKRRKIASKKYINRLRLANKSYLEAIENEAMSFIRDTINEYSGYIPMVSFSGGKDSSVVSELVRKALSTGSVLHIMADTTIEAPATYSYLRRFKKDNPKTPMVVLSSDLKFYETCEIVGPPSRILRWCCTTHKTTPISLFLSALRESNNKALTFDGIRASESARRKTYERISEPAKIKGEILASPIREWRDIDVWVYLLTHNIRFNTAYRYGFRRVGCLPCPFNSSWSDFLIKLKYPKFSDRWTNELENYALKTDYPKPQYFSTHAWRSRAGARGWNHHLASLDKTSCEDDRYRVTYKLTKPITSQLYSYLQPFGDIAINYDDGCLVKVEIYRNKHKIADININIQERIIRITIGAIVNRRLLSQRIERQLKKYQSCILCGGCVGLCESNAISVNGQYCIKRERCTYCLSCVKENCISVEALTLKGKLKSWSECDGSN